MTTTGIIAFLTALFGLMALIIRSLRKGEADEVKTAKALAHVEEDETRASMARVDAEYERLRNAGK